MAASLYAGAKYTPTDRRMAIAQKIAYAAFALMLIDALLTYIGRNILGVAIPVNAIQPLFLLLLLLFTPSYYITPRPMVLIWLFVLIVSFTAGFWFVSDVYESFRIDDPPRAPLNNFLFSMLGAMTALMIGFVSQSTAQSQRPYAQLFLGAALLCSIVCVIALLGVAPGLFPVIDSLFVEDGKLFVRPEILTDQNFQFFYIFAVALPLALKPDLRTYILCFIGIALSAWILAQVASRSGVLALAGTSLLAMAVAWWLWPGRTKIAGLVAAALGVALLVSDVLLEAGATLIVRFTEDSSGQTLSYRFQAIIYVIKNLADPAHWVPFGNAEFERLPSHLTGSAAPHFNPAAFFQIGGLLGLLGWVFLFFVPVIQLGLMILRRKADGLAAMIFCGGLAVVILQCTLNVPFRDQIWLWAGAVLGTCHRLALQNAHQKIRHS